MGKEGLDSQASEGDAALCSTTLPQSALDLGSSGARIATRLDISVTALQHKKFATPNSS
jgi:hypothetical protein